MCTITPEICAVFVLDAYCAEYFRSSPVFYCLKKKSMRLCCKNGKRVVEHLHLCGFISKKLKIKCYLLYSQVVCVTLFFFDITSKT